MRNGLPKSVHYWTVIRTDRNNLVKNRADPVASCPTMLPRLSTRLSTTACTSGEAGAAMSRKISQFTVKIFSNRFAS